MSSFEPDARSLLGDLNHGRDTESEHLPEQFPAPILRNDLQKAGGSKTIRLTRDDIAADFAAVACFWFHKSHGSIRSLRFRLVCTILRTIIAWCNDCTMTRAWRPQHLSCNTLNSAFSGCLSHCHTSIHVSHVSLAYWRSYFIRLRSTTFFNLLPGTPVVYQGSPPSLSVTGAVTQIPTDVTIVTPATGDELAMRDLFIPLTFLHFYRVVDVRHAISREPFWSSGNFDSFVSFIHPFWFLYIPCCWLWEYGGIEVLETPKLFFHIFFNTSCEYIYIYIYIYIYREIHWHAASKGKTNIFHMLASRRPLLFILLTLLVLKWSALLGKGW